MGLHYKKSPSVLMIGPLPPPTGGQSVLVANILESTVIERFPMCVLDIGHGKMGAIQRLVLTLRLLVRLLFLLGKYPTARVVHVHSSAGTPLFEKGVYIFVARLWRREVLLHLHGGRFRDVWGQYGAVRRRLTRSILSLCKGIVVLSDAWLPFYRNELRYAGGLFVLPNSVKVQHLPPASKDNGVSLLYVGHLKKEKGLLDLRQAIARLPSSCSGQLRVQIMGEGDTPENEQLVRAAFADLPAGLVEFLGVKSGEDKWSVFGASDILILPSHSEDLPLTILEAMALGIPVISTRVGAIPALVTEGVDGLLVEPGDIDGLCQAIHDLTSLASVRKSMGEAGRSKFQSEFSFERYGEKLEGIYAGFLKC